MEGLDFNSGLSSIDSSTLISFQDYRDKLVSLLQPILIQRFPDNIGKQKIRFYKDRIQFACPYCGDSMKSNYKKRGNFILQGKFSNFFKCHNCNEFKRIDHFFKDFKIELDLNVIDYIAKGIENFSTYTNVKYDMSIFLDMDSIEKFAIDRQEFLKYFHLMEVKDSPVWSWLKNRLQYDTTKFLYNASENYIAILNLTRSGKILGIQKRLFKGDDKYKTRTLKKIYEDMNKNSEEVPEEIDRLSQYFNICLVDFSKPITLFEGAFDAFLFKNSVANCGANKSFPFEIPVRNWLDKDKAGIKSSLAKEGMEIFLWERLLRDVNAPARSKWDLNDFLIWAKQNNIAVPNFENYFSNDPLDIIDL